MILNEADCDLYIDRYVEGKQPSRRSSSTLRA